MIRLHTCAVFIKLLRGQQPVNPTEGIKNTNIYYDVTCWNMYLDKGLKSIRKSYLK